MKTKLFRPKNLTKKTRVKVPQPKQEPAIPIMETNIVFVVDVTSSMSNIINAIKAGILHLIDEFERNSFKVRLGLVLFRDERVGELPALYPVGTSPQEFRNILKNEKAWGGYDLPESSLPAIMKALDLPGIPEGTKIVMLHVTDDACHDPEQGHTAKSVCDTLISRGVFYFGCTPRIEPYISFANATNGDVMEIGPGISEDAFAVILQQFTRTTIKTLRYNAKDGEDMPDIVRKTKLHLE